MCTVLLSITTLVMTSVMTSSMDHVSPLNPEQIDVLTGTYFCIYYY